MTTNHTSITLRAFFIPMLWLTAAIASAGPTGEPQDVVLEWNPTHLAIHAKEGDAKVHIDFGVSNPGREVVAIHKITPSCGCTVADHMQLPKKMKPGGRETIGLTVGLAGKHGIFRKSVAVISSTGRKVLTFAVTLPASAGRAQTMPLPERMNNIAIASRNRQAVFQGECRSCHVAPRRPPRRGTLPLCLWNLSRRAAAGLHGSGAPQARWWRGLMAEYLANRETVMQAGSMAPFEDSGRFVA